MDGPHTLAIDIGGTGLKASVLGPDGQMLVKRLRMPTPKRPKPAELVEALAQLVKPLPAYDRISAGFPGVIRMGRVITAPNLGTKAWHGFPLEQALAQRLGKPARLANDAEVQGLGVIEGKGLEVVMTLGTGIGSAVFAHGHMTPHLELAHHPIHGDKTYDEWLGDKTRRRIGHRKWTARVHAMINIVHTLLNYDMLYLGGGNSANLGKRLPEKVQIASNDKGITGGIRLWDDSIWIESKDASSDG
ncbi:MAG: ROK family protein [Alphaproteobacteria bacterium]|nr:ROK family protein [Alphaproteobacteria bacterium]